MWAFLSRRFRMWLVLAVGAPVAGWLLGKAGDTLEARGGETSLSRALHSGREFVQRHERGPIARRRRAADRIVDTQAR